MAFRIKCSACGRFIPQNRRYCSAMCRGKAAKELAAYRRYLKNWVLEHTGDDKS